MSAPDQSITANVSNDPKLERCTTFDGYTDEQWQSIKSIVRSIVDNLDIDDAVRVGKPAKPLRQAANCLASVMSSVYMA